MFTAICFFTDKVSERRECLHLHIPTLQLILHICTYKCLVGLCHLKYMASVGLDADSAWPVQASPHFPSMDESHRRANVPSVVRYFRVHGRTKPDLEFLLVAAPSSTRPGTHHLMSALHFAPEHRDRASKDQVGQWVQSVGLVTGKILVGQSETVLRCVPLSVACIVGMWSLSPSLTEPGRAVGSKAPGLSRRPLTVVSIHMSASHGLHLRKGFP
mgnify:FL=1